MAYRDRVADDLVRKALETFGAVILQGPRAVGKTTSGLQLAASRTSAWYLPGMFSAIVAI